ncbi:MAG: aspartate carbamoyltransferase [Gammaproteobacteria bacterium]|nr:aspartate carbamoyltransferase [Gammaproteobacteria bacterium]
MVGIPDVTFRRNEPDTYGNAHPKELLRQITEDVDYLLPLANQHIISADQFKKETLLQLFRLAAKYEANPSRFSTPLQGKILISAFYEPSTRTRLSFESAWHRLGGDIMSITDRATTGIAKGESLADIGEMFNNYGDCVVLRDTKKESPYEMMDTLRIPIINAGNGIDEHPTQALADIYTIFKWRPSLTGRRNSPMSQLKVGIIGVPDKMRTVRSLLKIMIKFPDIFNDITLIHDGSSDDIYGEELTRQIEQAGISVREHDDLDSIVSELDIVYINAIAWVKDSYESYGASFRLSPETPLKNSAIILHPLARGDELSTELDDTQHNWYFAQARGAVFLRMALLTCLVQRTERVMDVV